MMARKIYRNTFIVTLIAIFAASMMIILLLYQVFDNRIERELANTTQLVSDAFLSESNKLAYVQSLQLEGMRITWIASDGTVLYDNVANATQMENHKSRPEVIQAFQTGIGKSSRFSSTLSEKTVYYAMLQKDGTVVRLSTTQQSIWGIVLGLLPAFAVISLIVLILSAVLAKRLTRRTLKPLNELDLEHPAENETYEELSPLLNRLSQQNQHISLQMGELAKRQEELTVITDHMSEGLVVLGIQQHILSINKQAQRLFSVTEEACVGKHVLTLSRDKELESVVQHAANGDGAEAIMTISGRVYQLWASPVHIDNKQAGMVLLILDITERSDAERMRKEFSANVSHELKTPLTSISGYAEIMQNGTAKREDMAEFAGRIHDEANRMISLIDDIIKLSRLDEGSIGMEKEAVDLYALSQEVAQRLASLSGQYGVDIQVHGSKQTVSGVRAILNEMVYNLCENAIKYNKRDGRVEIYVDSIDGKTQLIVKDTGIGIPPALQEKVFERFYRVDKSRARDTGSTGLGLSIVKHGALLHGATISLTSAVGKGTEIRLLFPKVCRGAP